MSFRRHRLKRFRWLALLAVVAVVGYFGVSAYTALSLSRPDRKPITVTPATCGLAFETVTFPSRDDSIALAAWLLPARVSRGTIVMLHGHNSNRGTGDMVAIACSLASRGYTVLMPDFRGHGESVGDRTSLGQWERRDLLGAIDYLKSRGQSPPFGVLGFSMGAATALLTAAETPEIGVIVADSSFASLREIIDIELPSRGHLPSWFTPGVLLAGRLLLGMDLDSVQPERAMPDIRLRPVLIIHGEADALVPVAHAQRLAAAYGEGVALWLVAGADHVAAYSTRPAVYLARIGDFFDRALSSLQ